MKYLNKPLILSLLKNSAGFLPEKREILIFALLNIINTLLVLISTIILSSSLNSIFLEKNSALFLNNFLIIIFCGAGKILTGFILNWYTNNYHLSRASDLKERYFISFIVKKEDSDAADQTISILSDIEAILRFVLKFMESSFRLSLLIPISLAMLIIFQPLVIFIAIPVLLLEFYLTKVLSRYTATVNRDIRQNLSESSSFLKDLFMKKIVVNLFDRVEHFSAIFRKQLLKKKRYDLRRFWLNRSEWLIINIFSYSGKAVLFLYLGFSAIKKSISPGEILLLLLLLNMLTESFRELFMLYKDSFIFNEPAGKLMQLEATQITEHKEKEPFNSLEFRNVYFSYDNKSVLKGLSFFVNSGEFTVITGKTGSGKSTVFKLICGLLECPEGGVFINNSMKNESERFNYSVNNINLVFQDDYIFRLPFRDNIYLGRDYSGINSKMKSLMVSSDLFAKEKLFSGEEITISGGEQRKLSILRAWADDRNNLFLLDEPSNGIDRDAFLKFLNYLKKIDISLIVFTHEKWLIDKADKIISLDLQNDK